MGKKRQVKGIETRLNKRQQDAIAAAKKGEYELLISCCLECTKAIVKAERTAGLTGGFWSTGMLRHYVCLRHLLFTYIKDVEVLKGLLAICGKMEGVEDGEV